MPNNRLEATAYPPRLRRDVSCALDPRTNLLQGKEGVADNRRDRRDCIGARTGRIRPPYVIGANLLQ